MKRKKFDISIFDPCKGFREFYETQNSFRQAWRNCPRGDWMFSIANWLDIDIHLIIKVKVLCAELVLDQIGSRKHISAIRKAKKFSEYELPQEKAINDAWLSVWWDAYFLLFKKGSDPDLMKQTADICREILTEEVFQKINR